MISREFYKKRKGVPEHTGSIQNDTKQGKRGEGEKHPKTQTEGTRKTPQNPGTNTSH